MGSTGNLSCSDRQLAFHAMPPSCRAGASSCVGYPGRVFNVFGIQSLILTAATLFVFALQAWAFVDALSHRAEAFPAAGKLTKPAWLAILGLALVAHMIFWHPISLLNIAGTIAAIVYLVDVRPTILSLTRG